VNLLASRGDGFHVDTLDLYAARQRAVFIKQARHRNGRDGGPPSSTTCTTSCAARRAAGPPIQTTLEPKQPEVSITAEDRAARSTCCGIRACWTASSKTSKRCGVVGEETNKLVGYIAAVSRSLEARWP